MKIVCWKNKITGAEGKGEPIEDKLAEEWLEYYSKQSGELEHWLEIVKD